MNFRDVLNVLDLYPGDAGPLGGEGSGAGGGSGGAGVPSGSGSVLILSLLWQ